MKVMYWQGLMRSLYCPQPAQAISKLAASVRSKLPAAVVRPSKESEVVMPSFSAYSSMVSAPTSMASWPKATLQLLAKA